MFTGIVTDIGSVLAREGAGGRRVRIATAHDVTTFDIGASIACAGVCLTVVARGPDPVPHFDVEISDETIARSNLGQWERGSRVNLERPLRVGDELGGHIVSGHVDGLAEVVSCLPEGESLRVRLRAPVALARFIAPKGSVALDGVSLTVNEVMGREFGVNLIPHTRKVTTLGAIRAGDTLNLEIDTVARYVARLRQWDEEEGRNGGAWREP